MNDKIIKALQMSRDFEINSIFTPGQCKEILDAIGAGNTGNVCYWVYDPEVYDWYCNPHKEYSIMGDDGKRYKFCPDCGGKIIYLEENYGTTETA